MEIISLGSYYQKNSSSFRENSKMVMCNSCYICEKYNSEIQVVSECEKYRNGYTFFNKSISRFLLDCKNNSTESRDCIFSATQGIIEYIKEVSEDKIEEINRIIYEKQIEFFEIVPSSSRGKEHYWIEWVINELFPSLNRLNFIVREKSSEKKSTELYCKGDRENKFDLELKEGYIVLSKEKIDNVECILLVDDVVTSGTTLNGYIKALENLVEVIGIAILKTED